MDKLFIFDILQHSWQRKIPFMILFQFHFTFFIRSRCSFIRWNISTIFYPIFSDCTFWVRIANSKSATGSDCWRLRTYRWICAPIFVTSRFLSILIVSFLDIWILCNRKWMCNLFIIQIKKVQFTFFTEQGER